jgi:hypothetical protein
MKINNIDLKLYKKHPSYNAAATNERTIELPLGKYFIDKFKNNIIEVGAVTPYYYECKHKVYDLHDPYKNCIRKDFSMCDIFYKNENVLSISTLEHIGFNDYSKQHGRYLKNRWCEGFEILKKIVAYSKNYLLTIPIGYNPILDENIKQFDTKYIICKRIDNNEWIIDKNKNFIVGYGRNSHIQFMKEYGYNYQYPKFNNANAICIITNVIDFYGDKI